MAEEPNKVVQNNTADFSSFNAYGVVTLKDGQRVNIQMTMRHGMDAKRQADDFNEYLAFLNGVTDMCAVEFWAGKGSPSKAPQAAEHKSELYDWLRDPDGKPVIEKGKYTLLVDGGAKTLDDKFNLPCPLHSGKNLWLKSKDDGFWLSHKMETGGYCNANIHERVTPFDAE